MWFLKLAIIVVVAYACVVAAIYALQTRMLFPARLVTARSALPPSAIQLEIKTPDGETLVGVHISPERSAPNPVLILGFGGNAWHGNDVASHLHGLYPEAGIIAFQYRGYAPSTGDPSAKALLADAVTVFDQVQRTMGTRPTVAVGFSIGSGVAAHLASQRTLAGLILVSPFDSLEALAREHYPWAPVGWLLRHRMSTIDAVRGLAMPTAIIAAERDTVVPPARTEAVRKAVSWLVLDHTVPTADHNSLYELAPFRAAMVAALDRLK